MPSAMKTRPLARSIHWLARAKAARIFGVVMLQNPKVKAGFEEGGSGPDDEDEDDEGEKDDEEDDEEDEEEEDEDDD